MTEHGSKSNKVLEQIVTNSVFTPRQMSIIWKKLQGPGRPPGISSGAYYRQVKQCREKVSGVLYSVLLLQATDVLQAESLGALGRLGQQFAVILSSEGSDVMDDARLQDVMTVMDALVKRMSKL